MDWMAGQSSCSATWSSRSGRRWSRCASTTTSARSCDDSHVMATAQPGSCANGGSVARSPMSSLRRLRRRSPDVVDGPSARWSSTGFAEPRAGSHSWCRPEQNASRRHNQGNEIVSNTEHEQTSDGGANVGGATGPVEDAEYKSPAPDSTPGGATASPADEQPASEAPE